MQELETGKIYNGKVKSITPYGAFVDIEGGGTGMVHISEVANTFVSNISDFLQEGQEVKVRVLSIGETGKISLSIKKAVENNNSDQPRQRRQNDNRRKPNIYEPKKTIPQSEMSFEDMMSHFKQSSEERICDIKRNTDRKNKTRRK